MKQVSNWIHDLSHLHSVPQLMVSLLTCFPDSRPHRHPWIPPFLKLITSFQSLNYHFCSTGFQIFPLPFVLIHAFTISFCDYYNKLTGLQMIPLGKTLLFKLAKKYNIVLLRCFKVSLQLLSLLIFFLSEVITITCLLFIFPDTHIHTYFSSFLLSFLFPFCFTKQSILHT